MQTSSISSPYRYFVGLDVHQDTIVASVYDARRRDFCHHAEFAAYDAAKLRRFVKRVRTRFGEFSCCYEASSCGYVLYRSLQELDVDCSVIAPGSMPRRSGDRIKTDRRDARKLAEYFSAGLLTACHVPDAPWEAARGLVRSRATLVSDLHRPKVRVLGLLKARGYLYPPGKKPWTQIFMRWLNGVQLDYEDDRHVLRTNLAQIAFLEAQIREHDVQIACMAEQARFKTQVEILQGFRGIALFTAMQLVCELGDIRRFGHPTALMAYLGLVPSQRSSGATIRYGGITKTGNVHARKALVSAAWKYAYPPHISVAMRKRQARCSARTVAISLKAQQRLHKRYKSLIQKKQAKVAVVAIARELVGFLWEALQPDPTA